MLRLLCITLVLALGSGTARSQQSPPNPAERPPVESQTEGTTESQIPPEDQRPTAEEVSPVEAGNTADHENSRPNESSGEENAAESAIARYTWWLTAFTAILAVATIGLGLATIALYRSGEKQFAATHRPKIIVHTFGYVEIGGLVGASFNFVNAGTTRARILEISGDILLVSHLRPGLQMQQNNQFADMRLEPGEMRGFPIGSQITAASALVHTARAQRGFLANDIICIGVIRYTDLAGRERRTGFCRRLDRATRTWLRVESSDYEYSY